MDKIFSLFKSKKKTSKSDTKNIEINENICDNKNKQFDYVDNKVVTYDLNKSNIKDDNKEIDNLQNNKEINSKAINVVEIHKIKSTSKPNVFYYNKYIDKIKNLTPSTPILISNENVNCQLNVSSFEDLYCCLSEIYNGFSSVIESKQEIIQAEIKSTFELLNLMNLIYCDGNYTQHCEDSREKNEMMFKIDELERIIEKLENDLNSLENDFNTIINN